MRVKSVLLYILMIIVSTGVNILDGRKKEYTYINLILLLAILIFQILKMILFAGALERLLQEAKLE